MELNRANKLDCCRTYFDKKTEEWLEKDYMPMSWWKYDICIVLSVECPDYDWREEASCRSIFDILLKEKYCFYLEDKSSKIKKYRLVNNMDNW